MSNPLAVLKSAFGRWWSEIFTFVLLNAVWLGCQLIIIPGPPATATIYAATNRLMDGEYLTFSDVWSDFKSVFLRAWQWGIANLVVVGIALGNFYAYQDYTGAGWAVVRLVWAAVLLFWLLAQVFYWPFYYQQKDHSFRTTITNAARLLLANPGFGLFIGLFCLVLAVAGVLLGIPLGVALMTWLALIGNFAVRDRLAVYKSVTRLDD